MDSNVIKQVTVAWTPSRQLEAGLVVSEIFQDIWADSLVIQLGRPRAVDLPPLAVCRVVFTHVFTYRIMEDCDMSEAWERRQCDEQVQIITPSRFLAWFHQESAGVHLDDDLQHYRISTWDYCVDVITSEAPRLQLSEQHNMS